MSAAKSCVVTSVTELPVNQAARNLAVKTAAEIPITATLKADQDRLNALQTTSMIICHFLQFSLCCQPVGVPDSATLANVQFHCHSARCRSPRTGLPSV